MKPVKAKDLMIPLEEYPHIRESATLCEALEALERAELDVDGRKSLPREVLIFNEKTELLGRLRRRDVLNGLRPEELSSLMLPASVGKDEGELERVFGQVLDKVKGRLREPVTEVMRPIKESVDHEDDIIKIIRKVTDVNESFLPVLKDGEVAGVVRTVELVHELVKFCHVRKS